MTKEIPHKIHIAYRKWYELVERYSDNPTRGQKAALTRRWKFFAKHCEENDIDPFKYSKSEAQP